MKRLFSKKIMIAALACASVLAAMPISASAMSNKSTAGIESPAKTNMEWIQKGGKWYCKIDGEYVKGWLLHKKAWYYFDKEGVLAVDTTITIDGKKYSFDSMGACTNIKHSKNNLHLDI